MYVRELKPGEKIRREKNGGDVVKLCVNFSISKGSKNPKTIKLQNPTEFRKDLFIYLK